MKQKLFFTVAALLCAMAAQAQPLLKTHVETGDLEGVLEGNDLACYYAIPYAAPPVGDLRWKAHSQHCPGGVCSRPPRQPSGPLSPKRVM